MEGNVYLRQAARDDVELFFKWVNDSDVRANSFNTEPIPWESHRKWFEKALADDGVRIYVLMQDNLPVGQVRLTAKEKAWDIDYSVDVHYRGHGYGKKIFELLIRAVPAGTEFVAEVKRSNIASQHVFESLEYTKSENSVKDCYEYRKKVCAE